MRERGLRSFQTCNKAVASVEFAVIAPVFLAVLFALIETGIIMTKIVMLDHAIIKSARSIYTGETITKQSLEQSICKHAIIFDNCERNINVELFVVSRTNQTPQQSLACRDSGNEAFEPTVNFQSSKGSQIVLLRVCVMTQIMVPGLGIGLSLPKTATGKYQIVASTVFMNEPF